MTTNEYLEEVLQLQNLKEDSQELKDLRKHRDDVEKLLRGKFNESSPTIRYGGSKAKGTLIRESYDLDVICYFEHDDSSAGESLGDLYDNVAQALADNYAIERKNSSIRILNKDRKAANRDFHVDIVPGRFVDADKGDCYIHQETAEKKRLKTNLDVHIDHIRGSGVIDAVRLLKLWKARKGILVKQFVWELIAIELLRSIKSEPLEDQLEHVWTSIRDSEEAIAIEDPANPTGNDLSGVVAGVWPTLASLAGSTLETIEGSGWEAVFGQVNRPESSSARTAALISAAAAAPVRTSQWAS